MRYGPFADRVQEVLDLVDSGRILAGGAPVEDPAVVIEPDFTRACEAAWSQEPADADFPEDEDWLCWTDIRENAAGAPHIDGLHDRLTDGLGRRLLGPYRS